MTGTAEPETGKTTTESSETDQTTPPEKPEVDWKVKAREWEKRAKANADAATKLAQIEESQKTETQKLSDAKTAAEQAAAEAKADALRWRIAAKHQITDDDAELFLTGSDEETLTKQAERLAGRVSERKNTSNVVPKEGATTAAPVEDEMRGFTQRLFNKGD